MRSKRGAAILAGISAILLAVSLGYFALTPGAWASLDLGAWGASLLQTTAAEPDGGSAAAPADKGSDDDALSKEKSTDKKHDVSDGKAAGGDAAKADQSDSTSAGAGDGSAAMGAGSAADSGTEPSGSQTTTPAPVPANTVTISVSVSSSAVGNPVSSSGTFTFNKGATAYDALCALGLSVNASSTSMGIYVAAIGGLAEKEHGSMSGWKYAVNGSEPNYSAGGYELQDGDSVSWYYVTTA